MAGGSEDIIIPKVLIVPRVTPASTIANAPIGTLVMSGAKLYVAVAVGTFELVTSAA